METSCLRNIAKQIINDLNSLEEKSSALDKIRHDYTSTQISIVIRHLKDMMPVDESFGISSNGDIERL